MIIRVSTRILARAFAVVVLISIFFGSVGISFAKDMGLREASIEDIAKAEAYLQNMKTAQARFVQTTHDGFQLVGTFYLDRPGKVRFDYDPPSKSFVVADGMFIYFYDGELEEQTNAPIRSTLATFFLRDDFSLNDDLIVKDAKWANNLLQVKVVQAEEPDAGSITFAFDKEPFSLKKWRVVDQQNMITEVELFYLTTGIKHKDGLFVYKDPNRLNRKPTYND
ncbi:MAG: LolA family protein [Alphaproteobacteria bacterium]